MSRSHFPMPPRIKVISEPTDPAVKLTVAADQVGDGSITLLRGWSDQGELADVLAFLGPVFQPVRLPPDKELAQVTQVVENGRLASATSWHHDQSFASDPPEWSGLFCEDAGEVSVPTFFCDGAALLALMSAGFASMLKTLTARHETYYGSDVENVEGRFGHSHPVVCTVEGAVSALFVSPATVEAFKGWTLQESIPILDQLYSMMNWPEVTVGHVWEAGDFLLWPNRRYLHRALPVYTGERNRRLRRVGEFKRLLQRGEVRVGLGRCAIGGGGGAWC